MIFRIADDRDADAQTGGDGALGDGFRGVVGAFRVDVGLQFFEEFFDVGLGENYDVVDGAESSDEKGAGLFVENGTAGALERTNAGIGINGDDEEIAFGLRGAEIAGVADVERIEDAVGEDDALAALLGVCQ